MLFYPYFQIKFGNFILLRYFPDIDKAINMKSKRTVRI